MASLPVLVAIVVALSLSGIDAPATDVITSDLSCTFGDRDGERGTVACCDDAPPVKDRASSTTGYCGGPGAPPCSTEPLVGGSFVILSEDSAHWDLFQVTDSYRSFDSGLRCVDEEPRLQ